MKAQLTLRGIYERPLLHPVKSYIWIQQEKSVNVLQTMHFTDSTSQYFCNLQFHCKEMPDWARNNILLSNKIKTEWILVSFNKKCTPWYNVGRVWQWHLFKDEGFSTEQINIPKNMLTALHVPWLSHIECPKAEANIQKIDQASSITSPSATPGNMLAFYLDLPHCQHWQWGLPLEVSQTSQNL